MRNLMMMTGLCAALAVAASCSDDVVTNPSRAAAPLRDLVAAPGDPRVSSTDRILFDTRSSLQMAATLREALVPWGYATDTRPQWGFTTDMDGAGTNALRVDWPAAGSACTSLMPDVAKTLPKPYPNRIYMQWKHRLGRTATGGGLGDVDQFDVHRPECGKAGRFLWMAKRDGTTDRIELKWSGAGPVQPVVKSRGMTYVPAAGVTFDPQMHVGETLLHTLYVQAESSPGAADGVLRLWVNGQVIIDQSGLAIGTQPVYRMHFPWAGPSPITGQSEYFWDVLVWEPTGQPSEADRLMISPASARLTVGDSATFAVTRTRASGDTVASGAVAWRSLDSAIVRISATGVATAVTAGATGIIASVDGLADTAEVTVDAVVPDTTPPTPGDTTPPTPGDTTPPTPGDTTPPAVRGGHYASPTGTSGGDGTAARPWDLRTAFAGAGGRIQPGDTLWLRGGRYMGPFVSTLVGSPSAPIIVRAYPGERATLDNMSTSEVTLKAASEWVWYWGFETMNSYPSRQVFRPNCVYPSKANNKFINLIIHDCQVGMSFSNESKNSEVYGAIIYNSGYVGTDRTHGHGIYTKNDGTTPKLIRDNVVFNSFRNGIQVYTDAGSGQLRGIDVEGNTFFNNGVLSSNSSASSNILIGGKEVADRIVASRNMTYYSPSIANRSVRLGYSSTLENGSLTFTDNYVVGGAPLLDVGFWRQATIARNTFAGSATMVDLRDGTPSGLSWEGNTTVRDPASRSWQFGGTLMDFASWRSSTGLGASDDVAAQPPVAPKVFVRPNAYEPGRAYITVYNWGRYGSVSVDLGQVLAVGDAYELRNVQDLWSAPLLSGTYGGGTISVPMGGVAPPLPIGGSPNAAPRTGPDFDVFVVTRKQN